MDLANWKQIKNYTGYEISDHGEVRSGKRGNVKMSSVTNNYAGYKVITLHDNGKRKQFRINRLVLEHFVSSCPDGYQSNHKDGDKSNNNVDNLEWVSPKENSIHAYKNGLAKGPAGEINGRGRLKWPQVNKIRELTATGIRITDIAHQFNLSIGHVSEIKSGKYWKSPSWPKEEKK